MSLTSFLEIKDVKEVFRQEFVKPQLRLKGELLAPPLTNNYWLVGIAFDYLLRFYVKRLNPDAVERPWVSESSLHLLGTMKHVDTLLYKKVKDLVQFAKQIYNEFIRDGKISYDLLKATMLLAQVDLICRIGKVYENLGNVDEKDIDDLRNLISIVKPNYFKAKKVCILNPTFGIASHLVDGADGDLVIDDTLIDIKTTKKLELKRNFFDQLIGYYTLYKIWGIDGMPSGWEIKKIGIYFSRYAYLLLIDVKDIVKENTFPDFVKWFKKRAMEEYGFIKINYI